MPLFCLTVELLAVLVFETVADLREVSFPLFTEEVALLLVLVAEALSSVLLLADLELFTLRLFVVAFVCVLELLFELVLE